MDAQWISGLGVGGEKCGTLMRLLQRGSGLSSGFLQVESLLGGSLGRTEGRGDQGTAGTVLISVPSVLALGPRPSCLQFQRLRNCWEDRLQAFSRTSPRARRTQDSGWAFHSGLTWCKRNGKVPCVCPSHLAVLGPGPSRRGCLVCEP